MNSVSLADLIQALSLVTLMMGPLGQTPLRKLVSFEPSEQAGTSSSLKFKKIERLTERDLFKRVFLKNRLLILGKPGSVRGAWLLKKFDDQGNQ